MQLAVGLAEILGDLVIPAPVDRVEEIPMLGLAVRSDSKGSTASSFWFKARARLN